MTTATGTGTFRFTSWDEQPVSEAGEGAKLTRATVENDFQGAIEGKSTVAYVMSYLPDGTAVFEGYEQIEGSVDGHRGSFVLQHSGRVSDANSPTDFVVSCTWRVVPGSGSGELAGLNGSGGYTGTHGVKETPYAFDYELTSVMR
jgi:hypothetical protein